MLVRPRPRLGLEELLQRARPPGNRFRSVCLDGVGNAHNIGAIVRSMAFFGWGELAILGHGRAGPSALAPAAVRVAEGGAEHVRAYAVGECLAALRSLRALGVSVVVATQDAPRSYLELRSWPARAVLVVGAENVGVGDGVRPCRCACFRAWHRCSRVAERVCCGGRADGACTSCVLSKVLFTFDLDRVRLGS